MAERCSAPFDEALLSAYLDGELTQGESQPVRLHLEQCRACREMFEQMKEMRDATLTTPFRTFDDEQWNERPRGSLSRALRWTGWSLLSLWAIAAAYVAVREFATTSGATPLELTLGFGLLGGASLVFLSVLFDRVKSYKTDRYRRVQK